MFNTMVKASAKNASYDEGETKAEKMKACATGRSCPRKKEDLESERETVEVGSEGSSSPITPMVEKEDRSEGSSSGGKKPNGEEGEEERKPKKKKKRVGESKTRLGLRPYADWTYAEVLTENPRYVEFPIAEGRRDNLNGRFIQWAMGRAVYILLGFPDTVAVAGEPMTPEQPNWKELGKHEEARNREKANPSPQQLLEGHDC